VGERHSGALPAGAVKADWLVPLPVGLDTRQAMASHGRLHRDALRDGAGGRGRAARRPARRGDRRRGRRRSIAVALLARRGYAVHAVTGRAETHDYLRALGAAEILDRAAMAAPCRPLETQRWPRRSIRSRQHAGARWLQTYDDGRSPLRLAAAATCPPR